MPTASSSSNARDGARAGDTVIRAGVVLAGVLLLAANLRAGITSVGPVLGDIRADLGIGGASASFLISLPLIGFAVISPVAPAVARRLGLEWSLGGSLLLLAGAIVLRSLPVPGFIWVGTALLGIAIAVLNVLLPAIVKREYPGRVGAMTGIYSAVQSGVAAVAAGLAVPIAGAAATGWRLSLGMWAALALIGFGVLLPQLRRRYLRARRASDAAAPAPDATSSTAMTSVSARILWRSPLAWSVTLFLGLQSTVYYVVITWWPAIEHHFGVPVATAGWHQFIFQTLGIVGSLVSAWLIHRSRSQSALGAAAGVIAFVGVLGELLAPGAAVVWIALLGLFSGAGITIGLSLFGLRTHNHHEAAGLSGMAQSVGYLLAALGPIVVGVLHDATGAWHAPLFLVLGVAVGVFAFGILAGRPRFVGSR